MPSKNKPPKPERDNSLGETLAEYLVSLTSEERAKAQPEVTKFVRWYGEKRMIKELTAPEVENYTENLSSTITELPGKIDPVKAFLNFAYNKGFIKNKLALYLRVKRASLKTPLLKQREIPNITLSSEGHAKLEAELERLKDERPKIREEIHKAAADKDFRENAPLEAAREQLGKIEGKIRELESTIKSAKILNKREGNSHGALLGDRVVLKDLTTGETLRYMLVDIKEANPSSGKISVNSPIGKAIVGHKVGETIEVAAPAGALQFQLQEINQV